MKKSIVYAEMGNPWRFPSSYEVASCRIQFKNLHNFGKEGPLCGKLFINDIQLTIPDYDGFGGPIIKNNKYISTSLSDENRKQVKQSKNIYCGNRYF